MEICLKHWPIFHKIHLSWENIPGFSLFKNVCWEDLFSAACITNYLQRAEILLAAFPTLVQCQNQSQKKFTACFSSHKSDLMHSEWISAAAAHIEKASGGVTKNLYFYRFLILKLIVFRIFVYILCSFHNEIYRWLIFSFIICPTQDILEPYGFSFCAAFL